MRVKVLCVNIWRAALFEPLKEFLSKESPDILLMQEVFEDHYHILKKELGYEHSHFAATFYEVEGGEKRDQGNVVLSKFPLEHIKTIFYDVPYGPRANERKNFPESPRNLQHVKADIDGNPLHVFNTQGIWGEDGYDSERRFKMFETIIQAVKGFEPLVLAGDFNLQDRTEAVLSLERYLKNVFKGELKTSFNLKRKDLVKYPGFAEAVVDMMFVSKGLKVLGHSVPDEDISDHLPLVVSVEI